ncbi:transcriptional regulator [Paenibacillus pectinilyticus]|uniref:Transcriptional regulator n=1 Tax=Paenibacillus pectinilyticus TaxID=512399 RepID=A0A1C1A7U5_9BACL|nr:LysR family transcriptional regulator [Paenibacillus pectinilyticus]OCT16665.1 transcriptional regulator [Paenibacillus pectinilyticus]
MNWNLLKLQVIELLDKHKRITAVAEQLGLKQPTVSFHMKSMEQELGVQLFYSRGGKVHLTEAGQSLNHYAKKINALVQEAERVVKEFDERGSGHLKIGASSVPGTYILPEMLSAFSERFPHISVSLTVRPTPFIKEMLLNHEIDIGIMSAEPFQWSPLVGETLCEDELVFFFNPKHRFARQEILHPEFLNDVPFILHGQESSTRTMTLNWAKTLGVKLKPVMEMDSLEAIKQAVMTGESVSIISKIAIAKELQRGEVSYRSIPQNPLRRYIYFTYNADRIRSSVFDSFLSSLQDAVRGI